VTSRIIYDMCSPELSEDVQALRGGNVNDSLLLDLLRQPGLNQCTARQHRTVAQSQHLLARVALYLVHRRTHKLRRVCPRRRQRGAALGDTVHIAFQHVLVVLPVLPGKNVTVADHGDAAQGGVLGLRGLQDVIPIGQFAVALQATAAVQLHW